MEFSEMLCGLFEQVRCKSDFLQFLTELKQNNISYYIYFVATGNVKIVDPAYRDRILPRVHIQQATADAQ